MNLGHHFRRHCVWIFQFLEMAVILFDGMERFAKFGGRTYEEHLISCLKFGSAVQKELSFEDFSIFSSCGHLILFDGAELFGRGMYEEHLGKIYKNLASSSGDVAIIFFYI